MIDGVVRSVGVILQVSNSSVEESTSWPFRVESDNYAGAVRAHQVMGKDLVVGHE